MLLSNFFVTVISIKIFNVINSIPAQTLASPFWFSYLIYYNLFQVLAAAFYFFGYIGLFNMF